MSVKTNHNGSGYRLVTTAVPVTPPEAGPPRSYRQFFASTHPRRYSTDVEARGREIVSLASGRTVATCDTPGWAAQLAAAWNAERAPLEDHAPVPQSAFGDELSDNCAICGLATTSDGLRHGTDEEEA